MEAIRANAQDMARLANQLLTLSAVERRGGPSRLDRIDLVTIARRALESQVGHALSRDMDLGFDPKVGEAPVLADPVLMQELIVNLVDNALRYTPRGGVVTVGIDDLETHWLLTVRDNGAGIPPEERERVFERFYRILGNETEGSGLGLAIAREIAEGVGGTIALHDASETVGLLVSVRMPKPASVE